ncbi:hypothetical protein [Arthrobacter sp. ov118]|uniref:hypothetical protein n=1 Tax=Arthrobacter sp. ov118 TaxID=1761747 RepID=UPI001160AAC1|nr:hypothetical protein [Arthrobacter sp. ov118]
MPEIVPWVEAAIALIGLLLASLPQLTSKTRLRAKINFWGNQASSSDLEHDRKIAESLRRDASARLLALETYPSWHFLFPMYVFSAGFLVAGSLGSWIGGKYPGSFDYWQFGDGDPLLPFVGALGFLLVLGGMVGLGLVRLWRRRVRRNYLRAETIIRQKTVSFNAKGSPVGVHHPHGDLKLSILQGAGIMSFSMGLYALTVLTFFLISVGGLSSSPLPEGYGVFVSLLIIGGSFFTVMGFGGVHDLFTMERSTWTHPMPLTTAAAEKAESPVEQSGRSTRVTWWRRVLPPSKLPVRNS